MRLAIAVTVVLALAGCAASARRTSLFDGFEFDVKRISPDKPGEPVRFRVDAKVEWEGKLAPVPALMVKEGQWGLVAHGSSAPIRDAALDPEGDDIEGRPDLAGVSGLVVFVQCWEATRTGIEVKLRAFEVQGGLVRARSHRSETITEAGRTWVEISGK